MSALQIGQVEAGQTIYDCALSNNETYGGISERIIIYVDDEANAASVLDGFIYGKHKAPMPVTYQPLKNGSFRVKWKLENFKAGTTSMHGRWSATVTPKTARIKAYANFAGWDNRPSGQGDCKIGKAR